MLLQKLCEYAERDEIPLPPEMYTTAAVRWFIDIDMDGNLVGEGFVPLTGTGKKNDRGRELLVPTIIRASDNRAKLLADTSEYVLGIPRDVDKQERANTRHHLFKDLASRCAVETAEPSVQAVVKFLKKWNPASTKRPDDLDPSMNCTFRVGGVIPIDLPSVREFWARETLSPDAPKMQCIVCGEVKPVEKRLPVKIKRVPGGQSSGTALISANATAFESYALEASLTAPTCRACAERFGNAANALLRHDRTHITVGPLAYIFWTREEAELDIGALLATPDPATVRDLVESVWKGRDRTSIDESEFYATALSASGGRVVVRDWIETTVGDVKQNLARWFAMQRLVDPYGEEGNPVGMYALAASLYRDANRDMQANVPRALLRVALKGSILPEWLLYNAVRRNRAEQTVTRPRMVLTKMVLGSSSDASAREDTMAQLDLSNRDPAYMCGRLMAVLEEVQRAAVPGAKATIVGRYFGTASSAPASVFGNLLRGAQAHLDKLRKEKEGAYYGLQSRLEDVLGGLDSFPKTLSLKQQALFSLGYYHQRAADRAAARAHKEAKADQRENE
jgi:CRISPR-associated protein Csd1